MIRLREAVTGAEAEWDRHKWSGDKRFVSRLRTLANIEHVVESHHDTFAQVQARMAQRFPASGIEVVRQTKPEEIQGVFL